MATKHKNEWVEWLKAIGLAIVIAFFIQQFVFATSIVEGDSMEPALEDGERLIFNKLVYILGEPERGDIVIIQQPYKNYVKRIIALPGETVENRNNELYINGEKYRETFLTEETSRMTGEFGPVRVPNDSYFVMGDNRAISKDSRNGLGFIKQDEIIGKSELVIYPLAEIERTQ